MHAHNFRPIRAAEGYELCEICLSLHNTTPFPRENYLHNYWDESRGHSTLADQRHNCEVIKNEKGLTKVASVLQYCKPGSILEIACAPGSLLKIAREKNWEVEGCEPDEAYAGQISEYAKAPIHIGFFEDIDFGRVYSNVVALDLLEHLEDGETFIEKALSLLEDGGRLILMLPMLDTCRLQDKHEEHIWLYTREYLTEWLNPTIFDEWYPGHTIIVIENPK
jgi:2-polyprenyl-3-methyl-5-hydroxy-6-metoxy-1,4-benzoquinol methylase